MSLPKDKEQVLLIELRKREEVIRLITREKMLLHADLDQTETHAARLSLLLLALVNKAKGHVIPMKRAWMDAVPKTAKVKLDFDKERGISGITMKLVETEETPSPDVAAPVKLQ